MPFSDLNEDDRRIIGDCLWAAADGPFFPDWEFHTLFGIEREVARQVAESWPDVDHESDDVDLAVNNSIVHLIGYPHRSQDAWSNWIRVNRHALPPILARWRGDRPTSYFDALK